MQKLPTNKPHILQEDIKSFYKKRLVIMVLLFVRLFVHYNKDDCVFLVVTFHSGVSPLLFRLSFPINTFPSFGVILSKLEIKM